MTSPNPRRRYGLRAAATLAAAVVAVGVTALPAQAEEAPFINHAAAYPYGEGLVPAATPETERQPASFYFSTLYDPDVDTMDNVHVVFGVSGEMEGLTFETDAEGCIADRSTVTCDFPDAYVGDTVTVELDVLVGPNVGVWDEFEYYISVQPSGYDATTFTGTWEIQPVFETEGGYDVEVSQHEDVAPGSAVTPDIAFTNTGETAYTGVFVRFGNDEQFLDLAAEYGNCGETGDGQVICLLTDFTAEPGAVYELSDDTPVAFTLSERAPGPMRFHSAVHIEPIDVWTQFDIEDLEFYSSDTMLGFDVSDRAGIEDYGQLTVTSGANPYDIVVADQNIDAEADETATITIPIENHGPADALARSAPATGEAVFLATVRLPSGVAIEGSDEYGYIEGDGYYCVDATKADWLAEADSARFKVDRVDVQCSGIWFIASGESVAIELPVSVTDATPAADGRVVVQEGAELWDYTGFEEHWGLSEDDFPVIDADLENNQAVLALNSADAVGDGEDEGGAKLPTTGGSLTVVVAAAAAALAAGVVLFAVVRRRKAAADW